MSYKTGFDLTSLNGLSLCLLEALNRAKSFHNQAFRKVQYWDRYCFLFSSTIYQPFLNHHVVLRMLTTTSYQKISIASTIVSLYKKIWILSMNGAKFDCSTSTPKNVSTLPLHTSKRKSTTSIKSMVKKLQKYV